MRVVGRIDVEKFRGITGDLKTDVVVLTDKQRAHIMERRSETLERYESELTNIVENPDYIFADPKNPNTALLIKRYEHNAEVVLRLSTDTQDRKNSIITLWEIKDARLSRYLKTHKVIYKHE